MTNLDPHLREGGVTEVHDPLPGSLLLVVPQPSAAGSDATLRGDADHLGHHQTRTTQRLAAQVDEVEVAGYAVDGGVHVHRGNGDAVGQDHVTDPVRKEHRRNGLRSLRHPTTGDLVLEQPRIHLLDEGGIAFLQVSVRDAPTARHQIERELDGILPAVLPELLEPLQTRLGGSLGALDDRPALLVVGLQRRLDGGLLPQASRQRQGVLHRELRARSDAEVRRVRGIAHEDQVVVHQGLIADRSEGDPLAVVRDQGVIAQDVGEDLLDASDTRLVADTGR